MNESKLVVYQAHPVTGEYIGPCQADPDPLEEGNWLVPAMAFAEPPPNKKPGYAIVHMPNSEKTWCLLPDFRGLVYQTDTGQTTQWKEFGKLPANLTAIPYPGLGYRWDGSNWALDENLREADVIAAERQWRDIEIEAVKWLRERHRDQQEIGVAPTLSAIQFHELLVYVQALRDWPQAFAFPSSDERPAAPEWIADQSQ
ncbi:phage tail assembly chaperone [Pseudomonas fluorescens]